MQESSKVSSELGLPGSSGICLEIIFIGSFAVQVFCFLESGVCVCVHWASDTGLRSHLVSLSHECRVDSVRLQISAGKPESLGDTRVSILLLHLCFCFHGCRFQVVIVIGFQVAVSTKACVFNVVDLGRKINMQYSTS